MRAPRSALPGLLLLAGFLTASCGDAAPGDDDPELRSSSAAGGDTVRLRDASGREHRLDRAPRRILSLVPSATRILRELGAEERLVGRTDWDTARALSHLPSVGGGLRPSMERVVALDPDLVIRFQGESDQATPRRLDELGIRHFAIRPDGIDDVKEIIRDLGDLVGRGGVADSMVRVLDEDLAAIRERVRGLPRPSVAYLLGGSPPMVAGPGTFIHELVRIGGGTNAFADLERRYAPVSPEELVAREIDVILHPERASLPPGLEGPELHPVSSLVETPGPTLARAAREVARILHPEAFR